MVRSLSMFRLICGSLLVALATLLAGPAQAQTIVNTARASWFEAAQARQVQSNSVQFAVTPLPPKIETLRPETGAQLYRELTPSRCGGQSLQFPVGASMANGTAASGGSTILVGENIYVRISAPDGNRDPARIESIDVYVIGSNGDREQLTIFETGANTGIFMGAIATVDIPPVPVTGDCRVSVKAGDAVTIEHVDPVLQEKLQITIKVLADPFGIIFDSETGAPIDGATVTLVDAVTGTQAKVFAIDGVTPWPSTVISGKPVIDGNGGVHSMTPGEYRFPLTALGSYRIVVAPPAPYVAPSKATASELSALRRADGQSLEIVPASFGQSLTLASLAPVRVDIPVDRPGLPVGLSLQASRKTAVAGDQVVYTVQVTNTEQSRIKRDVSLTVQAAAALRIRPGSVAFDGVQSDRNTTISDDGRGLTIALGNVPAGSTRTISFAVSVRSDAAPGTVLSLVEATDRAGVSARASAALKIERDVIAGRMTLIGRIVAGGCGAPASRVGVPGVRVVLEDGSFAVTDADGRYHFEGLVPGTHVVQALAQTLPKGGKLVECARSTRDAGAADSRFIMGQGGSLVVADFVADLSGVTAAVTNEAPATVQSDRSAAGGTTDWLALGDGANGFLFPAMDHNPRAPAVRVVVRHRAGQTVALLSDGKPVDPLALDGTRTSPSGFAVSIWRGIPLTRETTRLTARLLDASGKVVEEFNRDVHFTTTPAGFELVRERSRLVADGSSRPILAVRVIDRFGRPVHAGLTGGFTINAPYESAAQRDALQARQLSGLDRAAPTWMVKGDDGVALIELAPTMVSGALRAEFVTTEGTISRRHKLEA